MATQQVLCLALLSLLLASQLAAAARQPQQSSMAVDKKHKKHPYTAPTGMFIQVRPQPELQQ
jgi:hypothetical protein